MDPDALLAQRLRNLRKAHEYTLEQLAARSHVSRSMISLIERRQTSPTAAVLSRLAAALGVSLPMLLTPDGGAAPGQPLSPLARQPIRTYRVSGAMRRQLSPVDWPSPLELEELHLPAGQTLALDAPRHRAAPHQQLALLEGSLDVTMDDVPWHLEAGDCLAMDPGERILLHNPTRAIARCILASASPPAHFLRPP